jgi:hypothetical protein
MYKYIVIHPSSTREQAEPTLVGAKSESLRLLKAQLVYLQLDKNMNSIYLRQDFKLLRHIIA